MSCPIGKGSIIMDEDQRGTRKGSSHDKVDPSCTGHAKEKGGHSAHHHCSSSVSSSNHHSEPLALFTQSTPSTLDTRPGKPHHHEEQHVIMARESQRGN
jgi:hypothetical protein